MPLMTGTIVIALLFVANELIRIFKDLNIQALPPLVIAQLVILRTPQWLVLTLPVGVAIGSSLAMSRLARESEVTAMRAAGVPVRRMLWPIIIAGLLVSAANLAIVELVLPHSSKSYRDLASKSAILAYQSSWQSNQVMKIDRYYVRFETMVRKDDGSIDLTDVLIFEVPSPGEVMFYQSPAGTYRDGVWSFPNSKMRIIQGDNVINVSSQDEFVINERIEIHDIFQQREPDEITARELWSQIQERLKQGAVPRTQMVAFHVKFSVPASCVIFAVTSALLAIWMSRAGPFVGLLFSLMLVLLYYNAYVISTQIVGKLGLVDPFVAAWLPNFIYIFLALVALWRIK